VVAVQDGRGKQTGNKSICLRCSEDLLHHTHYRHFFCDDFTSVVNMLFAKQRVQK